MDGTSAAAWFSQRSKVPHALLWKDICSSTMLKHPYNPYCASERIVTDQRCPGKQERIHDCECRTCQRKKKRSQTYMHAASHWSRATKRKRLLSTLHYHSQSSRDARRWDQHKRSRCQLQCILSTNPQRQKCWDQQKRSRCLVSMLLLKIIRTCIFTAFFNIGGVSLVEERSGSKMA